jgi:hypothetical protein
MLIIFSFSFNIQAGGIPMFAIQHALRLEQLVNDAAKEKVERVPTQAHFLVYDFFFFDKFIYLI